jgi:hypothetical protein
MSKSPKLRQANEPVTQATFDRLPLLLRASEVKWATGWTDAELAAEVQDGRIKAVPNAGKHKRKTKQGRRVTCKTNYKKYTKLSVARVLGFSC